MLHRTGRNDPCRCGSGKKYKRCCLATDEEEAREAARQQALLGDVDDQVGWDDDEDLDEAWDLDDDEFDLDVRKITRVCYARGLVDKMSDFRAGRGLDVTEWEAPQITEDLLDVIDNERLGQLAGRWGDPKAGEPTQVDVIDIETDEDVITIEIFNRGIALLEIDDDAMRRIHRACVAMETAARERATPLAPTGSAPLDQLTLDRNEPGDDG
jgi:hypothetical protein